VLSYDNIYKETGLTAPHEITEFLKKFKHVLTQKFTIIPRNEYKATASYLGITILDVKDTISQLTYKDYLNGPEKDKGRQGFMIWEFGVLMQGEDIYIKLSDDFGFNIAKCLSFHIAAYQFNFPYKSRKDE
jgi:hypothetical protein